MLWRDGALHPAASVRIAPDDRGFTLGDGVFETMRAQAGEVMHVQRHVRRLRDGAGVLGIPVVPDDVALVRALRQTLAANGIRDGGLRLTLSRGPAGRGIASPEDVRPTLLISAFASAPAPSPATLVVAGATRRNEFSPLSRIKSLNYLDSVLARREAERRGADDALLLNTGGRVAEGTACNLIVRIGDALLTPPVEDGALPGIARGLLVERGLLEVAPVELTCLHRADSLLLCNSLGLRAVAFLDGRGLMPCPELVRMLEAGLVSP